MSLIELHSLKSPPKDSVQILLNEQTKFRLNEINKIKYYFNSEIQERKAISKKVNTLLLLIMLTRFLLLCLHLLVH